MERQQEESHRISNIASKLKEQLSATMAEGESSEINRKIIESIEKASNDIDNLNYLLIDEAAMAARIEQMSRRVQARFANFSGPDSGFITAVHSDLAKAVEGMSIISDLASDSSVSEIQRDVLKTILDSANNPHRREMREAVHREYSAMAGSSNNPYGHEMREEAEKALGDMMRNPYMSEMQATAKKALSDCFSNPHWQEMHQSALHSLEDSFKNPYWEEMTAKSGSSMFGHHSQSRTQTEDVNQGDASLDNRQENLPVLKRPDNFTPPEVTTAKTMIQKLLTPEELKSMIIAAKSRVLIQQDPLFRKIEREKGKLTSSGAIGRLLSNTMSSLGNQPVLDNAISFIAEMNERSILQQQDELKRKYYCQAENWFREKELELIKCKERIKSMENNTQLQNTTSYQDLYTEEQNKINRYENEKRDLWILELGNQLGDDRRIHGLMTAKTGESQEEYRVAEAWYKWTADLLSNQEKSDAAVDVIPLLLSTGMRKSIPPVFYLGAKCAKDLIYNHMQATLDKDEPYNESVDRSRAAAIIKQIDPHQPLLDLKLREEMMSFPDSDESSALKVINRNSMESWNPVTASHLSDTERRRLGGN